MSAAHSSRVPVYWHPDIALHDAAAAHVAMASNRLAYLAQAVLSQPWAEERRPAEATLEDFKTVHDAEFLQSLVSTSSLPEGQTLAFDQETVLNRHTWRTLALSAGAWLTAVDEALALRTPAAFCVAYAGHHARHASAAGFCFTNQAAVAAKHALAKGARVAVLDIDTHAGDGTVLALLNEKNAFFGETYQPGFPGVFLVEAPPANVFRLKIDFAPKFRDYWTRILDKARAFDADLVLVSAGFDAHAEDPLTRIGVSDEDYHWLGSQIAQLGKPVVAGLEGGYNLASTSRAAALFLGAMHLNASSIAALSP